MVWGTTREPWSWHFRETNTPVPPRLPGVAAGLRPDAARERRGVRGATCARGAACSACVFDGDRARRRALRRRGGAGAAARAPGTSSTPAARPASSAARSASAASTRTSATWPSTATTRAPSGCPSRTRPTSSSSPSSTDGSGTSRCTPAGRAWAPSWTPATGRRASAALGAASHSSTGRSTRRRARRPCCERARRVQGPTVIRDWSYVSDRVVGPGWILCGDAACFIDPLFSTGVHLALSSGLMAAAYVATALADGELAAAAGPVYQEPLRPAVLALPRAGAALLRQQPHDRVVLLGGAADPSRRSLDAPRGLRPRHGRPVRQGLRARGARARRAAAGLRRGRAGAGAGAHAIARAAPRNCSRHRAPAISSPCWRRTPRLERKAVLAESAFAWGHVLTRPPSPGGRSRSAPSSRRSSSCATAGARVAELATALREPPRDAVRAGRVAGARAGSGRCASSTSTE